MRSSQVSQSYKLLAALVSSLIFFSLSTAAQSREHILYYFAGLPDCGPLAEASLIADAAGSLYGTTDGGGVSGNGCVFKISRASSGWEETVIYSFSVVDGWEPSAALLFDKVGNLYGTTRSGGAYGGGVAFELSPSATGEWTETVLHNFGNGEDGINPLSELIFDNEGNLYGTTAISGGQRKGGMVYKLSPSQDGWTESILYAFPASASGPDGDGPAGGVVIDRDGRLYGNTGYGGAYGHGAAYELVPSSEGYEERLIHSFDVYDGEQPSSTLAMDSNGILYGTTSYGGNSPACSYGCGTVFSLARGAHGKWTENVLLSLSGFADGRIAVGPVAFDRAGNLYAAAEAEGVHSRGSVFELTPTSSGTWQETVLYSFDFHYRNGWDGMSPYAGVIFDRGLLFGTTAGGGIHEDGIVFEIVPPRNVKTTANASEEYRNRG
jgi:uncharacterized repeat protein (TIGR03803 family)